MATILAIRSRFDSQTAGCLSPRRAGVSVPFDVARGGPGGRPTLNLVDRNPLVWVGSIKVTSVPSLPDEPGGNCRPPLSQ